MTMLKILPTLRYVSRSFVRVILIGFGVTLCAVAITDLVFFLTNTVYMVLSLTVPFEATTGIYSVLIGLILFTINFKVALANGVSRRSFLLANLPAIALAAIAFAIFNLVVVLAHTLIWPINMIGDLLYPGIDWAGLLIGQIALYTTLILAGWLVALVYYRASRPVQTVISLTPLALFGLALLPNPSPIGAVFEPIQWYIITSLGLVTGRQDPYIAVFSMLVWSVVLCGLVYLLLRRAPVKD